MKLLLTSAGVKNASIHQALLDLLGKPIADCHALCIPTAHYGHPQGTAAGAWRFVSGRQSPCPMVELGWKSVGLLELTVLPHLPRERWTTWVRNADILLADGGDAVFLAHWMRQSGLADVLPSMADKVWMGLSAGSMAMTPRVGEAFLEMKPSVTGDDKGLGRCGYGERCSLGADSASRLSTIAASTSGHFPVNGVAATSLCSSRSSLALGATRICAMAAAGLPARSSARILLDQAEVWAMQQL